MKSLCSLLLVLLTFGAAAQTDNHVIGKPDSVFSRVLNEKRKLLIYTPGNLQPGQRFPVLYVLDGDAHFRSVAAMIEQLGQGGMSPLPPMIVVAIPNTDRTRDLTPTHIDSDPPMMDTSFSKNTGGGENFAAFIEKELIPHIDSAYPTQTYRILIGHSFGGLTVLNILTNHPQLFNSYIAIDPSMWYDKERFLKTTTEKLAGKSYKGKTLYIGIANTMAEDMTLEKMRKDTSSDTRHIRSIFALDKFIRTHASNGLSYSSKYYPDDDHGSVPLITEYDGLRYIFRWNRLRFSPADFNKPGIAVVDKIKKHYATVSREMGYTVLPPEMDINGLGYFALSQKKLDKAAALFELNIANYPNSGNTYDSYGDLLLAKNDTAAAITNFKKALEMTKSEETRQKLDRLTGKATYNPGVKELEKFTGEFVFDNIPLSATIFLKGEQLWVSATGQGEFELVPVSINTFTLKNIPGYTLKFELEGDQAIGVTAVQPNGTFKAHRKK